MEINGIAGLRAAGGDAVFKNDSHMRPRRNPDEFGGSGSLLGSWLGCRYWRGRGSLRSIGLLSKSKLRKRDQSGRKREI